LLDSVMVCDGASGLLVTGRKEAEKRGFSKIVVPIGYGERTNYRAGEAIVDPTESGHYVAGQRAFAQSGLKPADIASFHPYDDFIIAIMLQLEMLGFCKRGQGCSFINEHDFTHFGEFRSTPVADRFRAVSADLPVAAPISSKRSGNSSVRAANGKWKKRQMQWSRESAAFLTDATGVAAS